MKMTVTPRTHLVIIDPQNDFCDIPEAAAPLIGGRRMAPTLPVPGADADMHRLAWLIRLLSNNGHPLGGIHVTLDSHNVLDIAHPAWWVDDTGKPPAPYTEITAAAVTDGAWRASDPAMQARSLAYVEALESAGRFRLRIWPEHCLIGHWGHNVHDSVMSALDTWAHREKRQVNWVHKGSNPFTEHYSAVMAEVPDPADRSTMQNEGFLAALAPADQILLAGEALSHCLASTARDIADGLGPDGARKLVLLEDLTSPVPGFEKAAKDFVEEMVARGMRVARSSTFLA